MLIIFRKISWDERPKSNLSIGKKALFHKEMALAMQVPSWS